jgi:ABC-type sugar transport system substrate-binding protein
MLMSAWTRVEGIIEGLAGLNVNVVQQLATDCDQVGCVGAAEAVLTAHPDFKAIDGACGPPRTTAPSSSSRRQRGVPGVSSPGTPSTLATKATRIAQLRATGYPAYTIWSGWLGRPDEKVRPLARSLSGARA